MNRQDISGITRRILPQILIQSFAIIITAIASFMFMTWFVADFLGVKHTYTAMGYETLGTLVVFIIILVPLNTMMYRRRINETKTLSEVIQKVAGGDYSERISIHKKEQLTSIYVDFNKMCAELESVQILRNDFINSYSHEFKTPISSINGFASLLLEKNLSIEEQHHYLEIIVEESARLSLHRIPFCSQSCPHNRL